MRPFHSIWLMPQASDEVMLGAVVDALAEEFATARFRPHLTLVEDQPREVDELMPLAQRLAEAIPPFVAPIKGIDTSEQYFRSFYARFEAAGPLLELKRRAVSMVAPGRIQDFMPHISLLYGAAESPEKRAAQRRLSQRLAGAPIRFDRVCVVSSAKEIPIEAWAIRASASLLDAGALASAFSGR